MHIVQTPVQRSCNFLRSVVFGIEIELYLLLLMNKIRSHNVCETKKEITKNVLPYLVNPYNILARIKVLQGLIK